MMVPSSRPPPRVSDALRVRFEAWLRWSDSMMPRFAPTSGNSRCPVSARELPTRRRVRRGTRPTTTTSSRSTMSPCGAEMTTLHPYEVRRCESRLRRRAAICRHASQRGFDGPLGAQSPEDTAVECHRNVAASASASETPLRTRHAARRRSQRPDTPSGRLATFQMMISGAPMPVSSRTPKRSIINAVSARSESHCGVRVAASKVAASRKDVTTAR